MKFARLLLGMALVACASACSDDDAPEIIHADVTDVEGATPDPKSAVAGFYVLNEGQMGQNKSTLDYYDYTKAQFIRNLYSESNPDVALELGDTGNDIAVHQGRLYVVVNGSHKVEVLDARTARRIGQVDINSPRYIVFDGDYAYVSSFVGGEGDNGSVVRFNLGTLKTEGSVSVGLAPEGMAVVDGMLYVANSQNYGLQLFDNKISVVRLSDLKVDHNITVGCNLRTLQKDSHDNLWVVSQGNYNDIPADFYKIPRKGEGYGEPISVGVPCTNFAIAGEKIYYYATVYDASWNATQQYGIVDVATATKLEGSFITDGTEATIKTPYCIAVQPANGDIIITDARGYAGSGQLRCYSPAGKLGWTVTTGDLPGHVAFVEKR